MIILAEHEGRAPRRVLALDSEVQALLREIAELRASNAALVVARDEMAETWQVWRDRALSAAAEIERLTRAEQSPREGCSGGGDGGRDSVSAAPDEVTP